MKAKSILISAISVFAFFMQLNAQTVEKPVNKSADTVQAESEATIVFDNYKHDFGAIKESAGKVSAVFTFTNKGDSPLVISKVVPSCGCTASEWTREPVAPGKQGYITATYDPSNRIYAFNKSLTVYSSGNPSRIVLTIQGSASK
jgi:hypothetical protein